MTTDKLKCKCEKSYIVIDDDNMSLTCGVRGLIDIANVRLNSGKVECSECHHEYYEQHDGS